MTSSHAHATIILFTSGFTKTSLLFLQSSRINNTFFGDPSKLVVLEAILEEIKKYNLQHLVMETGDALLTGLKKLQVRVPLCLPYVGG